MPASRADLAQDRFIRSSVERRSLLASIDLSGQNHLVATSVLGLIERRIRRRQQIGRRDERGGQRGDAKADGQRHRLFAMLQLQVRDRAADRFRQGDGLFGVEPRQQDDELLTAIARRDVAGALWR